MLALTPGAHLWSRGEEQSGKVLQDWSELQSNMSDTAPIRFSKGWNPKRQHAALQLVTNDKEGNRITPPTLFLENVEEEEEEIKMYVYITCHFLVPFYT